VRCCASLAPPAHTRSFSHVFPQRQQAGNGQRWIVALPLSSLSGACFLILTLWLALLSSGAAWAQNYDAGVQKYKNKDYHGALREFRPLANRGDSWAQNYLGIMYKNGYGVQRDAAEAVKWYRKAAEQGNAAAQTNLGVMYEEGLGIGKNYAEAVKWYRKGAMQGNAGGQNNLGTMYQKGRGVSQDDDEAVKWFRKAAEQGDTVAKKTLKSCTKMDMASVGTTPKP